MGEQCPLLHPAAELKGFLVREAALSGYAGEHC